jgi:anti-sigma B factor antagonist
MRIEHHGDTLRVFGVKALQAANAPAFQDAVQAAVTDAVRRIEIDLSRVAFLDSCGLGTLLALRKLVSSRGGVVRLLHPTPPALQVLELTRLCRVLEVVQPEPGAAASN